LAAAVAQVEEWVEAQVKELVEEEWVAAVPAQGPAENVFARSAGPGLHTRQENHATT